MKTKVKRMSKRTLAILLGMLMLITSIGTGSLITANADGNTKKIYINTANWGDDVTGVAYYAWAWEDGKAGSWYDFTSELDHYYYINVPKAVNNYAFFRASSTMEHGWTQNTNYWNKTGDLTGDNPKNLYTFAGYSYGSWSRYPNVAGITGITGDWTYPIDMTADSGTQYHYTVTGDNTTKEFRFYYNGNYYQSYENAFNLETQGEYKPYDGSNDNKKYGAKTGNSNSFALAMNSGYDYTIYFDNGKVWFNKVSNEPTHTVTISAGAGGSVSPSGAQTVGESTTTTVTATPETGYSFSSWTVTGGVSGISNGDTTNPATITASADGTMTANFTLNSHTLTKNAATNGDYTLSSSGSVNYGTQITITPTPDTDYEVDEVSYNDGTKHVVNYDNGYKFNMPDANTSVTVTFKEAKHTVTLSNGNSLAGSFTGSSVSAGNITWVNLPAVTIDDNGYTFAGWTVSSGTASVRESSGTYQVKASTDATITATYTPKKYGVAFTAYDDIITYRNSDDTADISGTVSNLDYGSTYSFKVNVAAESASTKYVLTSVKYGGETLTPNGSGVYSFTVGKSGEAVTVTYTTQYKVTIDSSDPGISSITVKKNNSSGENISSGSWVDANTEIYVKPTAASGYLVNTVTPALTNDKFTLTGAATITATSVVSYEVKYVKKGEGAGTVTINGEAATNNVAKNVATGSDVTFTATAASGSTFIGWYDSADCTNRVSENATYTVNNVQSATSLYAAFNYEHYYLSGYVNRVNDNTNHNEINKSGYELSQSSTNAFEYTKTLDLKQDSYFAVSIGAADAASPSAYPSAVANSGNDTVAGTLATFSTGDSFYKWKVALSSPVTAKRVTFTWNALTKKLKWTMTDVDKSDYTMLYVKKDENTSNAYIWSDTPSLEVFDARWPGAPLSNFPIENINDQDYYVIYLNNENFTKNSTTATEFSVKVNNGGDGIGIAEVTGLEVGKSYVITYNSAEPQDADDVLVTYDINLTDETTANKTADATSSAAKIGHGKTVTITTHPASGYTALVSVTNHLTSAAIGVTKSSDTYSFTMPAAAVDVNVTYVEKVAHEISLRTNDSSLGTLSAATSPYYPGDEVTITLNPASKATYVENSLKVSKSGDASTTYPTSGSGNTYTFIMPNYDVVVSASFEEHVADADFWYDGWQRKENNSNKLELQDGTGTKPSLDNLRFTEAKYKGNEYAYLKVSRSDEDPNTSGDKYQEFVIKTATDASYSGGASSSTGKYFYVRAGYPANDSSANGWNGDMKAKFTVNGSEQSNFSDMAYVSGMSNDTNYKVWRIAVPSGAESVIIKCKSTSEVPIDTNTLNGGSIGINQSGSTYFWDAKQSDQYDGPSASGGSGESGSGAVWFQGADDTTYRYLDNTGDNANKYGNLHLGYFKYNNSNSEKFAMQNETNSEIYVVILYPNKDYGSLYDGSTAVGSETYYRIYISRRLPGEDDPTVNYYAKDGVVRMWSKTTAFFGTTTVAETDYVTAGTSHNFNVDGNAPGGSGGFAWQTDEKWLEGTATKGQSITVSTQLTDDVKDKYYIKGFSFNGVTPEIYSWKADGLYSCTYTIPEDFKGNKLEITPIYFLKDDTNTITFYIDGFNETVQSAWGNELYVYPFYQYYKNGESGEKTTLAGQAENFRAYPGQPVVNYGGRRFSQIPLTDNGGAIGASDSYRVKGVTINNGYWDQVHGNTYGAAGTPGKDSYDNNIGADFVSVHRQTYDYDDFYKIYNENGKNGEKTLNSIYFTFKYKTKHQHRGPYADSNNINTDQYADNAVALTSSNVSNHDWELLKNNFKKPVDLFGTKLSDAAVSEYNNKEIYVISEGYEANNAGKFATEWAIYKRDGSRFTKITESGGKTSIVPSVLAIASADRITDAEYPALDGDFATTAYKGIYEALEEYKGVPVKICYEKELHGGSKSGGYDPAYRSDGRWTFTRTTDYIKGNVKIEYMNEKLGVNTYTEDSFTEDTHIGSVTGASAYFTYIEGESGYTAAGEGQTALSNLPIQDNKYFNFKAETAGSYEFIGWYSVDTNGDYHAVNNDVLNKVTGHSAMSTDSTFVARFKYVANGSLTISHTLASGNAGRGTTYLGVYVNGALIADEATNTDSVKLDKSYIGSNKTSNTIKVVLRTVANGENSFNVFTAKKTNDEDEVSNATGDLFNGSNSTVDQTTTREVTFTVGDLFESATQKVLALSYYSALTKPTNKYKITYNFTDRAGASKSYTVKGDFTDAELSSYVEGTGISKTFKSGATAFFADKAPHESNFQKTLTWTLSSMSDVSGKTWTNPFSNVYLVTASVNSTQTESVNKTAIFDVPYETNGSEENYTAKVEAGKVKMLADEAHEIFEIDTKYGKWFENIDTTDFDKNYENNDESSKLIIAPETITKTVAATETTMYFSYWKVSTLAKNGKAGKYVTKCFYPRFNYVAYDNYYIEAVYDSDSTKAYRNLVAAENLMDASISFLEDSRNQWNTNNDAASDSASVARDMIYNDFALAFKYQGKKLTDYTGEGTNDVRLGMVIQKLGQIDTSEGEHIGTLESYEDKYEDSVAGTVAKLQSALTSDTSGTLKWGNGKWANVTDAATSKKYASYNHIIAANNERITDVSDFNTTLIDNKNRTEYYYSLDNSQGQTADLLAKNVYNNKNYVYRVFSYIMVNNNGTWVAKVSEKPAYFCMYDRATRKH